MAHECIAPQCNLPIREDAIMCDRHWDRVPYSLQIKLWDEFELSLERGQHSEKVERLAAKAAAIVGAREGVMVRRATMSDDGMYRYVLSRRWMSGPMLRWVLCNPSRADDKIDTPTMKKLTWYTSEYQFAGFIVVNLFAFRSPNPNRLRKAEDPVGPLNDKVLNIVARIARDKNLPIVLGWGGKVPIRPVHRVYEVMQFLKGIDLWCLGVTTKGSPIHPRSAPEGARFQRWQRP